MIEKKYFTNNTIIVTTNNKKSNILTYISKNLPIIDIKVLTKKELIENLYFSYSSDILYYMSNKYHKNIDVCKNILDNLYYLGDSDILADLRDNKKINEYESIIKKYKRMVIYDIVLDDILLEKIKEKNNDIEIIKCNSNINKDNKSFISEFENIDEEVMFFFDKSFCLINDGIDINNIKLIIGDDEYLTYIDDYSKLYNIKVNTNKGIPLYSYGITKKILKEYKDGKSLESIIDSIPNSTLLDKIISIINKYDYNKDIYDVLKYEFNNNYISTPLYTNAIDIIDNDSNITNDTYLFILGFNQNLLPKIKKDDDYLKDEEKLNLHLLTSTKKNIIEKEALKRTIKSSIYTYISYKKKTPFNTYTKSLFLDELDLDIYNYEHKYNVSPSKELDKFLAAKMLDDMYKMGKKNDNLDLILTNIDNDYYTYNNEFKPLSSETLDHLLGNNLTLSYTSINSFYECKFKYFLKYLLKIKEKSNNMNSLFLGNLFHYVLSKVFNETKDIDYLVDLYLKEEGKQLTEKEQVYLEKYKKLLKELIDIINENKGRSSFKDLYYEKEYVIENSGKITVKLTGKIDKILSFNDGKTTYLIVIDYKTGDLKQDYNNIVYGLNMQLFTYAYILEREENAALAGFYLQSIGHDLINKDDKKDRKDQLKEIYSLHGYSIENEDIIYKIDNDLSSLKNVSINKDGSFKSGSLIYSDGLYNKFMSIVDEKINFSSSSILSGDFEIDPKEINDENVSCKYCKYFDICYKKYKDIKNLKKVTIEDYKAGDNNA